MKQTLHRRLKELLFLALLLPFPVFGQAPNDIPELLKETKASSNPPARKASSAERGQKQELTQAATAAGLPADIPNVNVSNLAGNEAEVSISVNPNNRNNQVIAGHAPGLASMNTFFSTDGGLTWTLVALGPAQDGLPAGVRFDPTVAFAPNGDVFVAYGIIVSASDRRLVVARSTNGGAAYTQFTTVETDASLDKWIINAGLSRLTAGQSNVYLAYRITQGANVVTRLAASYDLGLTFTTVQVNDGGNLSTFGMPAVGPDGRVYVVWDDQTNRPTSSDIRVDVSIDDGATFGTDVLIATTPVTRGNAIRYDILAQPDRGVLAVPSIAVDRSGGPFNGRVYVAYTTVGSGGFHDTDVVVSSSSDNGATWSAPVVVHNDGGTNSQFLPWLDVDPVTGQVVVVWYDARNDAANEKVEVFLGHSNNGGATFTNVLISNNPSNQSASNPSAWGNNFLEYIGVASLNGVAFPVWSDNSINAGNLDFFTDQIPIGQPPVADAGADQTVECASHSGTQVTLDGSGSSDPDNDPLTYTWLEGGVIIAGPTSSTTVNVTLPTGPHVITLLVNDGNLLSDTDEVIIQVEDTTPPVITLTGSNEITLECAVDEYTEPGAVATDICDSSVPVTISGTVDTHTPGTYLISYNAIDDAGNNALTLQRTVHVVDTTPPVITISSAPTTLWSPNHKYHTLSLTNLNILVEDACDTGLSDEDVVIVSVASDELEDAKGGGDGSTLKDMVIGSSCRTVDLRAERMGNGNGRVYTLTLQVADASGNIGTAYYQVHVPHSASSGPLAVADATQFSVSSPACAPAPAAVASARRTPETERPAYSSPSGFMLETNHPNPFQTQTRISFVLPKGEQVSLRVYNLIGQEVAQLVSGYQHAGRHELIFDASKLRSGTYLYRFEAGSFSVTKRMLLLK